MKYVMSILPLGLSLLLGPMAQAQTTPAWIQHAWAEDRGNLRPHVIAVVSGAVYVAGAVADAAHFGEHQLPLADSVYSFIARYESEDGRIAWLRHGNFKQYIFEPYVFDLTTDPEGSLYTSEGYDYAFDAGMFSLGGASLNRYSPEGDALWTLPIGSFEELDIADQPAYLKGLGSDAQGHLYVAGLLRDSLVLGTDTLVSDPFYADGTPSVDAFLASFDGEGRPRWSEHLASPYTEYLGPLLSPDGPFAVGTDGTVYVGGLFGEGTVFGRGQPGMRTLTRAAAALAAYDTDGQLRWLRLAEDDLGIAGDYRAAQPSHLAVAPDGALLVTWGFFEDGIGPRSVAVGDTVLTDPGYGGAFLTKYTTEGHLVWVRQFRSFGNEFIVDLATDTEGNVFVAGSFDALAFHLEETVLRKADLQADEADGFVAKYAPDGRLLWTLHAAGRETQRINALATSAEGDLYVAGEFEQEVRLGPEHLTALGDFDLFVAKYDAATITAREEAPEPPEQATLLEHYPNPFREQTTIRYEVSVAGRVRLAVYDVLGREVAVLVNAVQPAGRYEVSVNAVAWPGGLYWYRLQARDQSVSKPMIHMR